MLDFTLSEYDLGNSLLVPTEEGVLSFALNTEQDAFDRNKVTTITVSDADGKGAPGGTMDWKKKTIEIMGVTKPCADVKHKPGGILSTYAPFRDFPCPLK